MNLVEFLEDPKIQSFLYLSDGAKAKVSLDPDTKIVTLPIKNNWQKQRIERGLKRIGISDLKLDFITSPELYPQNSPTDSPDSSIMSKGINSLSSFLPNSVVPAQPKRNDGTLEGRIRELVTKGAPSSPENTQPNLHLTTDQKYAISKLMNLGSGSTNKPILLTGPANSGKTLAIQRSLSGNVIISGEAYAQASQALMNADKYKTRLRGELLSPMSAAKGILVIDGLESFFKGRKTYQVDLANVLMERKDTGRGYVLTMRGDGTDLSKLEPELQTAIAKGRHLIELGYPTQLEGIDFLKNYFRNLKSTQPNLIKGRVKGTSLTPALERIQRIAPDPSIPGIINLLEDLLISSSGTLTSWSVNEYAENIGLPGHQLKLFPEKGESKVGLWDIASISSRQMGGQDPGDLLRFKYRDAGLAVYVDASTRIFQGQEDPRSIIIPPKGMSIDDAVKYSRAHKKQHETVLGELLDRIDELKIAS